MLIYFDSDLYRLERISYIIMLFYPIILVLSVVRLFAADTIDGYVYIYLCENLSLDIIIQYIEI